MPSREFGDSATSHSAYKTQTVDAPLIYTLTPEHRLTFKFSESRRHAGPPEQIETFLSNAGIPADEETWRFDDGFAEKLCFRVDPNWPSEIPTTIFLGRDGRTARSRSRGFRT
ncbi:MAG: hypothetical protein P4L76_04995 [Beijerinckiaceae bacterium]|nr:hypothetical protein [Beijerinckiaceae bacterium]